MTNRSMLNFIRAEMFYWHTKGTFRNTKQKLRFSNIFWIVSNMKAFRTNFHQKSYVQKISELHPGSEVFYWGWMVREGMEDKPLVTCAWISVLTLPSKCQLVSRVLPPARVFRWRLLFQISLFNVDKGWS